MARASSIQALPLEVQKWLDDALIDNNFSGYQDLEEYLRGKGFNISRSAIHRYGQSFEKRLQAIRDSTKAAEMIAKAAEDQGEHRSEAVIALVQSNVFELLISLEEVKNTNTEDGAKEQAKRVKMLADVAHAMANLTRASVNLRDYQSEVKKRAEAAANDVEKLAKKGGLTDEVADEIRRKILGVIT
ncbi:MAG: DUF3486 family protein [Wohlfahrtiimonas sp.]